MLGQELVADIVKVSDQGHRHAELTEPLLDARHGRRRLIAIDRDAHKLGAGRCQRRNLARGRLNIGGIRVGHRLHHNRRTAANCDAANLNRDRFVTLKRCCTHGVRLDHRACGSRSFR